MLKHCIAALAMLGAVTADAIEPSEIFDLCPGEERMRLAIYVYPADSLHSQATSRRIMHAAESRLRAAQIYAPDVWPALEIAVNTLAVGFGPNREVFSVTASYYRPLRSPSSSFQKLAATWMVGNVGLGDVGEIMEEVAEILDLFLIEYLRVRDSKRCQAARGIAQ